METPVNCPLSSVPSPCATHQAGRTLPVLGGRPLGGVPRAGTCREVINAGGPGGHAGLGPGAGGSLTQGGGGATRAGHGRQGAAGGRARSPSILKNEILLGGPTEYLLHYITVTLLDKI